MNRSRRSFLQLSAAAALVPAWPRLLPSSDDDSAALCKELANDPLRPQYHLLPAHNWMNDPNGPIYFGGRYHMFHQYNPQAAVWGNMNWAHATSPDLIHWQHEPIAISPTSGGPDQDGVFSGSAVLDNGRPADDLHRRGATSNRMPKPPFAMASIPGAKPSVSPSRKTTTCALGRNSQRR